VLQLNGSWIHVSAALRPSSGQLVQIKCPQCGYNMGSHWHWTYFLPSYLIFKCDLNEGCNIFKCDLNEGCNIFKCDLNQGCNIFKCDLNQGCNIFKCDLNQGCNIFYLPEYVFSSIFLSHICHDCTHYGTPYCTHIEGTLSLQVGLKMAAMRPKHVAKNIQL
jgi:hypothetical protein